MGTVNNITIQIQDQIATTINEKLLDIASTATLANLAINKLTASLASIATPSAKLATAASAVSNAMAKQSAATNVAADSAANLSQANNAAATSSNNAAGAHGKNTTQLAALAAASRHSFDALAAGIPPYRVLLEESGNLSYGLGGLSGAFTKIGAAIVSPLGLLIAATVALIALEAVLANADNDLRAFGNALNQTGNFANVTQSQFISMANAIAAGSDRSIEASRALLTQLATTNQFQGAQLGQAGTLITRLSQVTGQSTEDIAKDFANAADSPVDFVSSLNKSYNLLSLAQVSNIKELQDQGKNAQALQAALDALSQTVSGRSVESLGSLQSAFNSLTASVSNFKTALLDAGRASTLGEDLAKVQAQIVAIKGSRSLDPGFDFTQNGPDQLPALEAQAATLQRMLDNQKSITNEEDKQTKIQRDGIAASADIANTFLPLMDNARLATDAIQKLHNEIATTLAANPNDKNALQARANEANLDDQIRRRYQPQAYSDADQAEKDAEKRADSINKINTSLDDELARLGLLAPARAAQQQLDQAELQLQTKHITLTYGEQAALKAKVEAVEQAKLVQQQMDALYNNSTIKAQIDLNNTITAANKLYASGVITAKQYFDGVATAEEKLLDSQNTATSGLQEGFLKIQQSANNVAGTVSDGLVGAFNDLGTSITDAATTGKFNFSSFATTVLTDLEKMVIQLLIVQPLFKSLSTFASSALGINITPGVNVGQGTSAAVSAANNAATSAGQAGAAAALQPFALGGSFTVDGQGGIDKNVVAFRATKGETVSINRPGTGSGSAATTVNVYNSTSSSVTTQTKQSSNGKTIEVMIDEAVAKNLSSTNSKTSAALRNTYNVAPALTR